MKTSPFVSFMHLNIEVIFFFQSQKRVRVSVAGMGGGNCSLLSNLKVVVKCQRLFAVENIKNHDGKPILFTFQFG